MDKKLVIGIILGCIIGVLVMFIVLNTSTHSVTKINNEIVEETYEYPDLVINRK